jgi:hypothetical protein
MRFLCFATAIMFGSFLVGLEWGVVGVAGSYAVARTIILVTNSLQMARLMEFDLSRMLLSYLEIIGRSAAAGAAVFVGRLVLIDLGVPVGARLAILIVGGAVFYLLLTAVVAPGLVRDARDGLFRRRMATA